MRFRNNKNPSPPDVSTVERHEGERALAALRRIADAGDTDALDALLEIRINTLKMFEVFPEFTRDWPDDLGVGELP